MEGNEVEQLPKITEAKDIADALETIKSIEMIGYALDDQTFKLKFATGIFRCMDILRKIHDDLVSRLPPEVIQREQAKANPAGRGATPAITPEVA